MSEPISQPFVVSEPALGHVDALPVGTMLGEFELQGLLGVGGFGMVYKGYDHSLHRPVAIKEYMPSTLVGRTADLKVSVKSAADDQSFQAGLTSFIAEARLLARFDHPSLVKVYRFWEANNTAYMVMPLYQGITLKQARLQMSAPPPEEWLRTVLWSVAEALKVLHGSGTIHRDVSPDNIFLQDVGPPVLLDLGAARRAVLDRGHKHTAILKVNYAPIEQYADATDMQEGPWTDLYALGAVVHGCLCNEPPLPATIRVVRDRMPSFFRVAQTVQTHFGTRYSSTFVDAIAHTLVIQPAHRTQNALDFCEEMQLEAPEDIARFNWRVALGDSVVLGDDISPDLLLMADDNQAMDKTQVHAHVPALDIAKRAARSRKKRRSGRTRPDETAAQSGATDTRPHLVMWWVLLFLLAAAVALGVAALLHPERPASPPLAPVTAPETANAPTSAESVAAPPVADAASTPVPTPLSAPAHEVVPVVVPASPVQAPSPPAALPASAPVAKASVAVPPKPVKSVKPAKSPAPSAAAVRPSAAAAPVPVPTPAQNEPLCADATALTRSMCIFRYCQKREFADLPVCVEDRKRWERDSRGPGF